MRQIKLLENATFKIRPSGAAWEPNNYDIETTIYDKMFKFYFSIDIYGK
jgi:hypothetical protein